MTAVILAALERLEGSEREQVIRVFTAQSPPQADVDIALTYVRSTGAGGVALGLAHTETEAAVAALEGVGIGAGRAYLTALALEVANRRA